MLWLIWLWCALLVCISGLFGILFSIHMYKHHNDWSFESIITHKHIPLLFACVCICVTFKWLPNYVSTSNMNVNAATSSSRWVCLSRLVVGTYTQIHECVCSVVISSFRYGLFSWMKFSKWIQHPRARSPDVVHTCVFSSSIEFSLFLCLCFSPVLLCTRNLCTEQNDDAHRS